MTKEQLAALLQTVSVEDIAREAKVAPKTIYRLRHMKNSPKLDTVGKLVDAVKRLKSRRKAAA